MDPPELSGELRSDDDLPFRLLSDADGRVVREYHLLHEDGGLDGEVIAVPAQLLVRQDGSIVWKHVARRITDRSSPRDTLDALGRLGARDLPGIRKAQ